MESEKNMSDLAPNHVINIDTDKIALILPPDLDYNLVESIIELSSRWEYLISFKGVWGTKGTGREGEEYFADHYDFEELKRIASAWDLNGHTYSILVCANPNFVDKAFYKFLYLMGEGDYSGTGPIHLTQEEKRQLAEGWGISLEKLILQLSQLKIVPHETPSCVVTQWLEWSLEVKISVPPVPVEERIAKIGEIIAFHAKEIQRLREDYFKTLYTAEERQYYLDVWGFDPATDRNYKWEGKYDVEGEEGLYQYETYFPLLKDPQLHAVGVELGARVRVIRDKNSNKIDSQVRIVFRRGEKEVTVDCVHIILSTTENENISEVINKKGWVQPPSASALAPLSILEHFVALKSYVAGIAEIGILQLLWEAITAKSSETENLGFGFNPEMQMQVMRALNIIASSAMTAIKRDWLMQLVDSAPIDWFNSRIQFLVERDILRFNLQEIPKIFPTEWLLKNKSKLKSFFNSLQEISVEEAELGEGIDTVDMNPDDIQLMDGRKTSPETKKQNS